MAHVPSNQANHGERSRKCERCYADMRLLGELPALSAHPAVKVFRCYGCDYVISERG